MVKDIFERWLERRRLIRMDRSTDQGHQTIRFLDLPRVIRDKVYGLAIYHVRSTLESGKNVRPGDTTALLRTCKQIKEEATPIRCRIVPFSIPMLEENQIRCSGQRIQEMKKYNNIVIFIHLNRVVKEPKNWRREIMMMLHRELLKMETLDTLTFKILRKEMPEGLISNNLRC